MRDTRQTHIYNTHTYCKLYIYCICVRSWLPSRRSGLVWSRCLSALLLCSMCLTPAFGLPALSICLTDLLGSGDRTEDVSLCVFVCVCVRATSYERAIQSTEIPPLPLPRAFPIHTYTHTHTHTNQVFDVRSEAAVMQVDQVRRERSRERENGERGRRKDGLC